MARRGDIERSFCTLCERASIVSEPGSASCRHLEYLPLTIGFWQATANEKDERQTGVNVTCGSLD
jgi:hypothetical protein